MTQMDRYAFTLMDTLRANLILSALCRVEPDPATLAEIDQLIDRWGLEPVTCVPSSTSALRHRFGWSAEDHNRAVGMLLRYGRIQQLGSGRGRGIVVWDPTPVSLEDRPIGTPFWGPQAKLPPVGSFPRRPRPGRPFPVAAGWEDVDSFMVLKVHGPIGA